MSFLILLSMFSLVQLAMDGEGNFLNGSVDGSVKSGDVQAGIVKEGHVQNSLEYTLFSDGTAMVTSVAEGASFDKIDSEVECDGVTYIVRTIGSSSLNGGKVSGDLVIPDSVTTIGQSAFSASQTLKSVSFGSGLITIGDDAFSSCQALKKIVFNNETKLKFIGNRAFTSCLAVEDDIILPDSVESIGDDCFFGIAGQTNGIVITLGEELSSIGIRAFDASNVRIEVAECNCNYSCDNGRILYSEGSGGKTLVKYFDDPSIQSLEVPEDVISIGEYAFKDLNHLKGVTFGVGSRLKEICDRSFVVTQGTNSLEKIVIPESCEYIGEEAFFGTALVEIRFDNRGDCGLTIGSRAFSELQNDEQPVKVIFNDDCRLTSIGSSAFQVGGKLITQFGNEEKKIKVPASVKTIGDNAFNGSCKDVTEILFMGVDGASELCILGVKAFASVLISDIGRVDLSYCSKLLIIPDSCFESNVKDTLTITLPPGLKEVGVSAFKSQGISFDVVVPDSVEILRNGAFFGASTITFGSNPQLRQVDKNGLNATKSTTIVDLSSCINLEKLGPSTNVKGLILPGGVLLSSDKMETVEITHIQNKSKEGDLFTIYYGSKKDPLSIIEINKVTRAIPLDRISGPIKEIKYYTDDNNALEDSLKNKYFEVIDRALYLRIYENGEVVGRVLVKVQSDVESFTVPNDVVSIVENAFGGCSLLKTVFFESVPEMSGTAFGDCEPTLFLKGAITGDPTLFSKFGLEVVEGQTLNQSSTIFLKSDAGVVKDWSLTEDIAVVSFNGGYTTYDVAVTVNGTRMSPILEGAVGKYDVTGTGNIIVDISPLPRVGLDTVTVTFDANGGFIVGMDSSHYDLIIPSGMTIIDCEMPKVYNDSKECMWMSGDAEYDFDEPVAESLTLVAKWLDRDPIVTIIDVDGGYAQVMDGGNVIESGAMVGKETTISIRPIAGVNYEFVSWTIRQGSEEFSSIEKVLYIKITNDTTIEPRFRYYQSSMALPSITSSDNVPTYWDLIGSTELAYQWEVGGFVNTAMSTWTGGVSVPLIVDNYVYIRQADHIYKIESDTGLIVDSVESKNVVGFYHHLGYGDGLIIDTETSSVYDLGLNKLFVLERSISSVYYNEGFFYSIVGNMVYKFDTVDSDPSKTDEKKSMTVVATMPNGQVGSFGTFAEPLFIDGCIYTLVTDGPSRKIVAVSIEDGKVETMDLKGLENHLFDDGWLTYYEGRIYVTSYTVGLFGSRVTSGDAAITSISVSGLNMSDLKITPVSGISTILSKFVIYEGRGYLNASINNSIGIFQVYDVSNDGTLKLVNSCDSAGSHGSIVLNVSEDAEDRISIYLISYSNKGELYVFGDDRAKGVLTKKVVDTRSLGALTQYCSQAVRIGLDGQLIWYNDTGQLMSFIGSEKNRYSFFIQDGSSATWYESYGTSAADALSNLGPNVVKLDENKGLATVNGKKAFDKWSIYVLTDTVDKTKVGVIGKYGWVKMDNFYSNKYDTDHFYIITDSSTLPTPETTFTYAVVGGLETYEFSDSVGDRSVVGKELISATEDNTVTIRFYENGVEMIDSVLIGVKGSSVTETFPSVYMDGKVAKWEDSEGNAVLSFPSIFDSHHRYYLNWVNVSATYDVGLKSDTEDKTRVTFNLEVTRNFGLEDLEDTSLFVIAYYDGSDGKRFISTISKIIIENGNAKSVVSLSSDDLVDVSFRIIQGPITGTIFNNYGSASWSVAEGA